MPGASNVTATNGAGTGSGNGTLPSPATRRIRRAARSPRTAAAPTTATAGRTRPGRPRRCRLRHRSAHPDPRERHARGRRVRWLRGQRPGHDPRRQRRGHATTGCYRYTLTGTDNVGNQSSVQSRSSRSTPPRRAPRLCSFPISPRTRTTPRARCTSAHRQVERPRHGDVDRSHTASRRTRSARSIRTAAPTSAAPRPATTSTTRSTGRRPCRAPAHRHRCQRRRRRLGQRLVPDRRRRGRPHNDTCRSRCKLAPHGPPQRDGDRPGRRCRQRRVQRSPAAPARGRQSPPTRPRATASRRASTRQPWPMDFMTCVTRNRRRRQHGRGRGRESPDRQHEPDRLGHLPAGGANVSSSVALASNSADAGSGIDTVQFQRSPAGAGTWTSQSSPWATTGVTDGLYDLRVVTTDNAGNPSPRARPRCASTTRRRRARSRRRLTAPASARRSRSPRTPQTPAVPASAPSCSSARRSASGAGRPSTPTRSRRTRSRSTRPPSATASTTCARRRPTSPQLVHVRPCHGHGRQRRTEHIDHVAACRPDELRGRLLLLHLQRGRLDLRVSDRRRRLGHLHEPQDLPLARRRLPHLPGPRDGRGRHLDASAAGYTWLVDGTNPTGSVTAPADAANVRTRSA